MNIEAFHQLLRVLRKVRDEKKSFRMDRWWVQGECGTAGCAIGYACQDPWFIERYLVLVKYGKAPDWVYNIEYLDPRFKYDYEGHYPEDHHAVAKFFQISKDHVHMLFYPDGYEVFPVSVEHVIFKIEAYLALNMTLSEVGINSGGV